jgi:predicted aspartyl protease
MARSGGKVVGRITIDFDVTNYGDRAAAQRDQLDASKVRHATIRGIVDTGATRLVLPEKLVKKLGLDPSGKVKVRYADGRIGKRDTVEGVYVELLGRHGIFTAIVEKRRKDALIGAIVLEDLDLIVDCQRNRLIPRDPDFIISEIE